MIRMLVLSCVSSIWLISCAAHLKASVETQPEHTWQPVLAELNRDPKSEMSFLFSASINLEEKYKQEILLLNKEWQQLHLNSTANKNAKQKNLFIHQKINLLNEQNTALLFAQNLSSKYQSQAQQVLESIEKSAVASVHNVEHFSEGTELGFCFGRALMAHFLLLKEQVPQRHIFKLFALGDFPMHGHLWRYHVAVAVADAEDGAIVIDPLYEKVLPIREWMQKISSLEIKQPISHARFYLTDPRKFMPASSIYEISWLTQPELRTYFSALNKEISAIF